MASEPKYDIFRDPIHGFIKVYDVEKDIINSKPFQRLRRIRQLGLTSLVYHGAEHTRFGHSVGVMNFASKVLDSLWARYNTLFVEKLKWNSSLDCTPMVGQIRLGESGRVIHCSPE